MSYSNYDLNTKLTALSSKVTSIVPSTFNVLDVIDTIIVEDGLGTGNNATIKSTEISITNGLTTDYLSITPTTILIDSITNAQSTTISPNYIVMEKVGDTHQTHMDNTQVHILDTETLDEMFIDHNSLILVQPTTTHQTELLSNMLDFQSPQNLVSCGHTTYQNGAPGFEVYDLVTGNNALLTYGGLTIAGSSGTVLLQSGNIQMSYGFDSIIIQPTVVSVQGITDKQVNHYNNKIDFVQSLAIINTLDASNWSGGIKSEATVMNANHYLLGSMTATTSSDRPQKNSNLYFNPSLQTLYSTTFSGNLTGTASSANTVNVNTYNLATTCYLPFISSTAGLGKALYVDDTTGPLTYNPSTSTVTASIFSGSLSGNATSASSVLTISDNTAGSFYLPFVKTTALVTPNQQLYIDDTTVPLTYNPSTGVITATNFTGAVTGTASAATLAANSSNVNLVTTLNLATYTLGTTLTITGAASTSFKNSNIIFTGTSNTVSILTLVSTQVNGEYSLGIFNNGSGNLVFTTGLGVNIRTTYSSSVNISPGAFGYMNIRVLTINALTVNIVSVNQLTG